MLWLLVLGLRQPIVLFNDLSVDQLFGLRLAEQLLLELPHHLYLGHLIVQIKLPNERTHLILAVRRYALLL